MSGNWNTKPRRGEKSVATQRSDHEHAIRKEYHAAGELDGLVRAWCIAADSEKRLRGYAGSISDGAGAVAVSLAMAVLEHAPKAGRVELVRHGIADDALAHVERCLESKRRLERDASKAARELAGGLGDLGLGTVAPKGSTDGA